MKGFCVLCVAALTAVAARAAGDSVEVSVDPAVKTGAVKPVNGVGQPPMIGKLSSWRMLRYLKEAGIPYSRLHDVGGWLGNGLFVDVPNVFPDFSADETDPASYRFVYTDSLVNALIENGVEPQFRLGTTIENWAGDWAGFKGMPAIHAVPPKDFAKWARICEHIIRHYTEGWAGGFRHRIEYWEIWNEPDLDPNPSKSMTWQASFSEYCRLYGVAAKHLKKRFPHLKIGGPASCGFYAAGNPMSDPRKKHHLDCIAEFLDYVKANDVPMDFFSYHSYAEPEEVEKQIKAAETMLAERGLQKTETWLNEWLCRPLHRHLGTALQASSIAAQMLMMQNSSLSGACIYDARCGTGSYSPLFNPLTYKPHKAYYAFTAFNELRKLGTAVKVACTHEEVVAAAAAKDGSAALMVANPSDAEIRVSLDVPGYRFVSCRITDDLRTDESTGFPTALPPRSFAVVLYGKDVEEDYVKYVDVFTGTAATGHTTPAAAYPFGMVQAGPDTGNDNWAYCSGYQYADQTVMGYSQTHISGSGCTDMGDVQILPFTGALSVCPTYRAVDKNRERAEPGYYTTVQSLDALKVEITATRHVGVYRVTSLENRPIKVLLNPNAGCNAGWGAHVSRDGKCDVSVPGRIRGGYVRDGWIRNRPMFYAIEFSRPWKKISRQPVQGQNRLEAFVAEFGPDELTVHVALSMTSSDAAAANMKAESSGRRFDALRAQARSAWNSLLARTPAIGEGMLLKNWYTSLYHLYFHPNDFSDVGAEPYFTTLSLWDTFRAAQPWYTIAVPEIVVPEINSMLKLYRRHGNLPRMSYGGGYVDCMIGDHMLPVIADAYLKGFRGFDEREALEAMVNTVSVPHKGRAKENWDIYEKYGYLPYDLVRYESCSRTLETAYDDWCLAEYAEALGEKEIAARFRKRSGNWKNVFDSSIGFARGKDSKGKWMEPFDPYAFGHETTVAGCFTEGNSFQYSWHVMHDVPGLIAAMGGKKNFTDRLDRLFTAGTKDGFVPLDVTGMIGQYVHGNEPSHHIIYFYPQVGRPERAAERIREVFDRFYFPGPSGLSGNDDCGQMSAWYVFSAMGFYPFNPCGGEYVIGAPQLSEVTLNLTNGKVFRMKANNLSKENKYVKSVTLNGKPVTDWKIRHSQITAGGELVFEMGR